MKTVFGLFEEYQAAAEAVDALLEAGFDYEELNVLVTRTTTENWSSAPTGEPPEQAEPASSTLDEMLDRRHGIVIPETGASYAAGPLANLVARSAVDLEGGSTGLEAALTAFNLAPDAARSYRAGIHAGGLLVFVRSADERAAEAANLMKAMKATQISIPN